MKMKLCKDIKTLLLDIEVVYSDFLDSDGIPWNNNIAERAIPTFFAIFPAPSIVRSSRLTYGHFVSLNLAAPREVIFCIRVIAQKLTLLSLRLGNVLRYLHL